MTSSTPISEARPWQECRNSAPWVLHYFLLHWEQMPVGSVGYDVVGCLTKQVSRRYQ